jgi:hypothetical protein
VRLAGRLFRARIVLGFRDRLEATSPNRAPLRPAKGSAFPPFVSFVAFCSRSSCTREGNSRLPPRAFCVAFLPVHGRRYWNISKRRKRRVRKLAAPWLLWVIVSRERYPQADVQTSTTLPCLIPPRNIGPGSRRSLPSLPPVQNLLALGTLCRESIIGFVHSPTRALAPARRSGWPLLSHSHRIWFS